jgi:hypothetical protein
LNEAHKTVAATRRLLKAGSADINQNTSKAYIFNGAGLKL